MSNKKNQKNHDYGSLLSNIYINPITFAHQLNSTDEVKIDFKSKYILLPYLNPLKHYCIAIIDKLMLHPMDSYNGISVACEQPMGNKIMLNIKRPGVLRQYYGADITRYADNSVKRFTYGYGSERNSVGLDPNKFVTKPFDDNMH